MPATVARRLVLSIVVFVLLAAWTVDAHAEPVHCKQAILKASAAFARVEQAVLWACVKARRKAGVTPAGTLAACKADAKVAPKLVRASNALGKAIDRACGGKDRLCGGNLTNEDSPSSIGWPSMCPNFNNGSCVTPIFDCNDITTCLRCIGQSAVEQIVTQDDETFINQPAKSPENKCQLAITTAVKNYFAAKSGTLQRCWNKVVKGKSGYAAPCPAGDASGKTQKAIDAAEEVKVKAICKACGGKGDKTPKDGQCDASGFDPQSQIGFGLSCPSVQAPSGADCGAIGTITTLQNYIDCVDCLADFSVECTDRSAVPGEAPYPGQCNPGSTISITQGLSVGKDLEVAAGGSIGHPAPAGNLQVTITSLATDSVLLSTSAAASGSAQITITVSAGSSALPTFYVHGLKASGTVTIKADAPGYSEDLSTVTLYPSGFALLSPGDFSTTSASPDTTLTVYAARLDPSTLNYAENQAVRGGLTVDVPVASATGSVGTIVGSPAEFHGGDLSNGSVTFHPQASGSSVLSLGVPAGFSTPADYQQITATVTLPHITLYYCPYYCYAPPFAVGRDLEVPVGVYLDAAPPGPITITVTSSDGTLATVSVDGTAAGGNSDTIPGVSGSGRVGTVYVQGRALGGITLTAQATGYADGSAAVSIDPSGFALLSPGDFSTTSASPDTTLTVYAARLDPDTLNYAENQAVRGGLTVDVPVASATGSVGTIAGSPAEFQGGDASNGSVTFHPQAPGSSVLSLGVPAGFSTPTDYQQITATVTLPHITLYYCPYYCYAPPFAVGRDLQVPVGVYLDAAPPGPITITVTSSDGTLATVSVDGTAAGGNSDTIAGVSGSGRVGTVYVQGRALGGITLTAQATGYADGTAAVSIDPSGFALLSPGDFSTTSVSPDTTLTVYAARLDPSTLNYAENQAVRGGLTVDVPVASATSSVGTIVGSPAEFHGGDASNGSVTFHPQAPGSSVLSLGVPAGFSTPTDYQQITATVTLPHITLYYCPYYCYPPPFAVGRDLQAPVRVYLDAMPPNPITITVTSSDGTVVTLSSDATAAGGTSDAIPSVSGSGYVATLFAQGMSGGSATLTAHASGYIDGTATVSVDPSGFITYTGDFSTTTSSGDSALTIYSARLDPLTLNLAETQAVRGGLTVDVPVISLTGSVGTIAGSPAVFQGGDASNSATAFHPQGAGMTGVYVDTPAAFSTPSNYRGFTVTVTP